MATIPPKPTKVKIDEIYLTFIVVDEDGNRGRVELTEAETRGAMRCELPDTSFVNGKPIQWLDYPNLNVTNSIVSFKKKNE